MDNTTQPVKPAIDPHVAVRELITDSRRLRNAIAINANTLAECLEDTIRSASSWRLKQLKRALQDFNAHTGKWNGGAK